MTVTASDLIRAVEPAGATLRAALDRDWSAPARDLEWSCRQTAEHLADALIWYAVSLFGGRVDSEVPLVIRPEDGTDDAMVLDIVEAGGRVLASAVTTAPDGARAYHGFGIADREAFAAMGVVETLLHTDDIARGLGVAWDPPRDLCDKALHRLFRNRPEHGDAWEALLWCTGRTALPGRPRLERWRWWNDPSEP